MDALPVEEMVLPLVVLDVREQVKADHGFAATDATVRARPSTGRSLVGRFVALLTGWGEHWPDPAALVDRGHVEAETYVLSRDRWQIELMANLDRVPARGSLIVATWPKPMAGSGFPARCFATTPESPGESRTPRIDGAHAPR